MGQESNADNRGDIGGQKIGDTKLARGKRESMEVVFDGAASGMSMSANDDGWVRR